MKAVDRSARWISRAVLVFALGLSGCGEDAAAGAACVSDDACADGFCLAGACRDPGGDEDGDGVDNASERERGLDALKFDTDLDGTGDGVEGGGPGASDCDGDAKEDGLEASTRDADADAVPDQFDPDDQERHCGAGTVPRLGERTSVDDSACAEGQSVEVPPERPDGQTCLVYCCAPQPQCEPECEVGSACELVDGVPTCS